MIAIVCLISIPAVLKAQQQFLFKPMLLPNVNYSNSKNIKLELTIDASSAPASSDLPDSMRTVMNTSATTAITTGLADSHGIFPIKMATKLVEVQTTCNGKLLKTGDDIYNPIVIHGKYSQKNKLNIDSLTGDKTTLKIMLSKLFLAMQNNVVFPGHALKTGESFTCAAALIIPGLELYQKGDINATITYTFVSAKNNVAVFAVSEKIGFSRGTLYTKGSGTGTLKYDMRKRFFTSMANNIHMSFNSDVSDTDGGRLSAIIVDKTEIAAN